MPKPTYQYIWSFDEAGKDGQEAPKLIGANGTGNNSLMSNTDGIGGAITPDIEKYTYVNVSREFAWTLNDEREEVPRIILKELTQTSSALLSRGMYYLGQVSDIASLFLRDDPLDSYAGLYNTDDTGFYYDIPQLNETYLATGNHSFGSGGSTAGFSAMADVASNMAGGGNTKGGNIIGKATGAVTGGIKIAKGIGDAVGSAREFFGGGSGYYTEQPQFFQHGQGARSYPISFPLYNTGDYSDMIRNFQLVFMLVYQNLPNRSSKQLVKPPCIYEITVPGVSYTPFAYMSSVKVDFVGQRREMTINIPFDEADNLKPIRVTIPDAYNITMNVQELVAHTKNFMYHNVNRPVNTGIATVDQDLGYAGDETDYS
jgi:hypothetical protein